MKLHAHVEHAVIGVPKTITITRVSETVKCFELICNNYCLCFVWLFQLFFNITSSFVYVNRIDS